MSRKGGETWGIPFFFFRVAFPGKVDENRRSCFAKARWATRVVVREIPRYAEKRLRSG
jgi:hypothetical protein